MIYFVTELGNAWRDNNHDGGPGNIGVVFKVHQDATVRVGYHFQQTVRVYNKQKLFELQLQALLISLLYSIQVRWPTGELRRYKYGKQGYFEVELWYYNLDIALLNLSVHLNLKLLYQ